MSSESKNEIKPTQEAPAPSPRKVAKMSDESVSHLRKSLNASSPDVSMYHVIAAYHGEQSAQHIAERMHWDIAEKKKIEVNEPARIDPFTRADMETALRKVSRKITPK